MKGIVLAGRLGTRLHPLTKITNKHLLPVYDKPMTYYPLETLAKSGIEDIMIVTGSEHSGDFIRLLENGEEFKVALTYRFQREAGGIAQALSLAEDYSDGEGIAVILGDNIFQNTFEKQIRGFASGAHIFLKEVPDPSRFGVAEVGGERILSIEEKPKHPKSSYAVTGLYLYDKTVFDVIRSLKPSERGELEITDVNNRYIESGVMGYTIVEGYWTDAGTFESLSRANDFVRGRRLIKS